MFFGYMFIVLLYRAWSATSSFLLRRPSVPKLLLDRSRWSWCLR